MKNVKFDDTEIEEYKFIKIKLYFNRQHRYLKNGSI